MKRDINIDILRGMLIILVIIGHQSAWPFFNKYLYFFHMPIFFLLGGYYHKQNLGFINFCLKKSKQLLFPYFLGVLITIVYWLFFVKNYGSSPIAHDTLSSVISNLLYGSASNGKLEPNTPIWFFPSYFFYIVISNFILKMTKNDFNISFFISVSLIFGMDLIAIGKDMPFGIYTAIKMVPFYFVSKLFFSNKINISIMIFCFISMLLFDYERIDLASGQLSNYFSIVVYTYFSLHMLLMAAKVISKNNLLKRYFLLVSKNAVPIIIIHMPILVLCNGIMSLGLNLDYSYVRDDFFFSIISVMIGSVLLPIGIDLFSIGKLFDYSFYVKV